MIRNLSKKTKILIVAILGFCRFSMPQKQKACSINICLPLNYVKHIPPPFENSQPIEIRTKFHIKQISKIKDKKFWIEFKLSRLLEWLEPRWVFSGVDLKTLKESWKEYLSFDMAEKLWHPNIFIYKLQEIEIPVEFNPMGGKNRDFCASEMELIYLYQFWRYIDHHLTQSLTLRKTLLMLKQLLDVIAIAFLINWQFYCLDGFFL